LFFRNFNPPHPAHTPGKKNTSDAEKTQDVKVVEDNGSLIYINEEVAAESTLDGLGGFPGNTFDCSGFANHMAKFVGETVTIFTTSGGPSGFGFTGLLIFVNKCIVRLLTQIGPGPGCALGNCCNKVFDDKHKIFHGGGNSSDVSGATGRFNCDVSNVGSVTDIPVESIAAFVHNAV